MKKRVTRIRLLGVLAAFVFLLIVNLLPNSVLALGDSFVGLLLGTGGETVNTEPEKWYYGSDITIDEHFIFGEDRMYTEGKPNRGFNCLFDNNVSVPFYVTTNDTGVNYQDLTGKEISVTFHTNSPVIIDHFKIISGGDTYKANYSHRSPTAWNLKAGNSVDSCDTVLAENLPVKATSAYEVNTYEFENTTPYKYYKFTITALAGAGRSGHDSPFSNPTATCLLADVLIGGPEPAAHTAHNDITFEAWNSKTSLPTTAGNYYLTDDVTVSSTWSVPSGATNLCLNGYSITYTGSSGAVFYAGGGRTLNIYECDKTVHYYSINSETHLAENINTTSGDYSFVGGYITGGKGYYYNGGYRGGAAYIQGGTVNIHGGAVIGNKASNGEGGGFYIEYGTLTMSDGYIVGNVATSDGGGLQVTRHNSAYFYMTGGAVSNNTAFSHGGGLTAYNVADISGGYITGNQCLGGNKTYYKEGGGGIQIEAQGKLSVGGDVEISGNKSSMSGGGILVWGDCSYFRLSGSPIIKDNTAAYGGTTYTDDNIRLNSSKTISISGALSCAEPIGVSVSSSSNSISGTGVFTSDWCTHMDGKDPDDYFASDNANYGVILNGGEVEISVPPVASVISGDTTTNYGSFPDAVNAWLNSSDGATLKLLKDVSYNDKIILSNNKTRVLDLNGKTFTRTVPSGDGTVFDVNSAANFTLTDTSKEQTGIVTRQSGNYGGTVLFVRDSGSVINFNAGKLTGFTSRVIITWQGSTVNMSGGEISGNNLNNGDATDGIVRTYSSTSEPGGTFNMTGGRIVNNTLGSGKTGGAVYAGNNGTFNISGEVEISGNTQNGNPKNVYLPAGNTIKVTGVLTGDKSISVTLQNGAGTFTNGWNTYMSGKDPADYFVSDVADYEVRLENGEAVAEYPYVTGVTASGYTGDYDGKAHSISVSVPEGASVKYGTADGTYNLSEAPAYTSAGTYNIYYKVSQNKRTDLTGSATVKINKINATVTITGHNSTVDYDGKAHSVSGYGAVASTDLYDVTKDFTFSGNANASGTNAGKYSMGLKASQFANTSNNFETVTFNVTDGYLTVSKINVTVTIVGNNSTVDYDGKEHTVTGYTATTENSLYDVTKDFTFSGKAAVTGTNAGTYNMGLAAGQFTNTNSNFETVAFNITDGYLAINKINATVTIIGNNGTVNYDGKEHTVTGYTATTENSLYDVTKDFTFSGNATVSATNAGTYNMGLAAGQFANTNNNFETVTFNVTDGYLTINKINATVTVTGNNAAADYDGKEHTVSGYTATVDTNLYDVGKDFTFSGSAAVSAINAGTYNMGLAAGQFANTNNNFETVTFNVTDGYLTINKINATVTVTGNNGTADYDGNEHTVTGYTAAASTTLYDVTKDFTFGGTAVAAQTDAGKTYMGLSTEQFANINPNFKTVTFEVTDGYSEIVPVDAVFTSLPHKKDKLTYTGQEQELLEPGTVIGGTVYYAIGEDENNSPKDSLYSTNIPKAADVGNYYIWYIVKADSNHNDLAPAYVKVTLAEEDWVTITGNLYKGDQTTAAGNTVIRLKKGNEEIDRVVTAEDGEYQFTVPKGAYNILVEYNDSTVTTFADISEDESIDLLMPNGKTKSILNTKDSKGVVVGGLDAEALALRKAENIDDGESVTVAMTVEAKAKDKATGAQEIQILAKNRILKFFEIKVEKTVGSDTAELDATLNVMEIVIPYGNTGKRGIAVYRYHGSKAQALTESDSKENGTFRVDKEAKLIYIYANQFSTYSIGYIPYYRVQSKLSLGSYKGRVTVVVTNQEDSSVYKVENAPLDKISFADIPRGKYTVTVTWKDGVSNTLTMPLAVS